MHSNMSDTKVERSANGALEFFNTSVATALSLSARMAESGGELSFGCGFMVSVSSFRHVSKKHSLFQLRTFGMALASNAENTKNYIFKHERRFYLCSRKSFPTYSLNLHTEKLKTSQQESRKRFIIICVVYCPPSPPPSLTSLTPQTHSPTKSPSYTLNSIKDSHISHTLSQTHSPPS